MSREPAIYGLMSTRDGIIRYVGRTDRDAPKRADEHYRQSNASTPFGIWKREELFAGYSIDQVIIETPDITSLADREIYWIERLPNLLNIYHNQSTALEVTSLEDTLLSNISRHYSNSCRDNWAGFVGIRYIGPRFSECEFELTVFDPFGEQWARHLPLEVCLNDVLECRCDARASANAFHLDRFGISFPWPADQPEKQEAAFREVFGEATPP